jgi:hypothetical protein
MDTLGFRWEADQKYQEGMTLFGYVGGQVYTNTVPIANTSDDVLYQTERFNLTGYRFWTDNGTYTVTLKFAEIYAYARLGERNFDVRINGAVVDTDLDPYTMARAKLTAVDRVYTTEVTDGLLSVDFIQNTSYATIDAIKIEKADCTP